MSQRCPSLDGDNHYCESYSGTNSPSYKQKSSLIKMRLLKGLVFQGKTSEDAYEFIGKHFETVSNYARDTYDIRRLASCDISDLKKLLGKDLNERDFELDL